MPQIAIPAGVLARYFLKSLFQIVDQGFFYSNLSDDCADKLLGHLMCGVSEMKSPLLLSSGIYFKLMWPRHREFRQNNNSNSELPSRTSVVSQWQLICILSSAGS